MEIKNRPQSNKNFTMFPNEIYDNLLPSKFTLREIKVILAIIRRTYGYQRTEAEISLRMFEKITNIDHWNIHKVIKKLIDSEIIFQTSGAEMKFRKSVHKYSINTESYHRWNTRIGVIKTTETDANNIPIKYRYKIIKKGTKWLGDKFSINK